MRPLSWLQSYRKLDADVLWMVSGVTFVNLVNAGFFLVFNLYLRRRGYDDALIGELVSLRYAGVLLASLPMGIYIRARQLRPVLLAGALAVPVASVAMLWAVSEDALGLLYPLIFLWGVSLVAVRVCAVPYILRHTDVALQPEAVSLQYAAWPLSVVGAGVVINLLAFEWGNMLPVNWLPVEEGGALVVISLLGFGAVYSFWRMGEPARKPLEPAAQTEAPQRNKSILHEHDWRRIFQALLPTLFLAVGAGLTIPFLNLFFNEVFSVSSQAYGLMGATSSVLVFLSVLLVPAIQKRYGYTGVVVKVQLAAVFLLLGLASTELFATHPYALALAVLCLLGRDPLMNMAGPMTNELVMNHVGPRNHEMLSALTTSLWSGGWFISGLLFKLMREASFPYWQIFFITGLLYALGVLAYWGLIRAQSPRGPVKLLSRVKKRLLASVAR